MNLPSNPAARRLRAGLLSGLALLGLAPAGRATDIAHAAIPSIVADNKISIGSHAFKLPPGQWMLVQGQMFKACWILDGHAAHLIYEDGDQGLIPLQDFKAPQSA